MGVDPADISSWDGRFTVSRDPAEVFSCALNDLVIPNLRVHECCVNETDRDHLTATELGHTGGELAFAAPTLTSLGGLL